MIIPWQKLSTIRPNKIHARILVVVYITARIFLCSYITARIFTIEAIISRNYDEMVHKKGNAFLILILTIQNFDVIL